MPSVYSSLPTQQGIGFSDRLLVKGNQPHLFDDVHALFAPPAAAKRAGEGILRLPEQHAQTVEKGHGRVDIRSMRVSSELKGYSD
jgi:hypothetical protein